MGACLYYSRVDILPIVYVCGLLLLKIEESMDKYFRAFNLINLNEKLGLI
jgi:hypothetical protein